jgi:Spy/CpxP family protein refolding chaperone
MRIPSAAVLAALAVSAVLALGSAPGWAQVSAPGASAADPQNGAGGSGGGGGRRGGRGGSEANNKKPTTPRADDKAFRSAIDQLPDQKYDPWRGTR